MMSFSMKDKTCIYKKTPQFLKGEFHIFCFFFSISIFTKFLENDFGCVASVFFAYKNTTTQYKNTTYHGKDRTVSILYILTNKTESCSKTNRYDTERNRNASSDNNKKMIF